MRGALTGALLWLAAAPAWGGGVLAGRHHHHRSEGAGRGGRRPARARGEPGAAASRSAQRGGQAGRLAELKAAALLVRIGLDHEPWLARPLRAVGDCPFRQRTVVCVLRNQLACLQSVYLQIVKDARIAGFEAVPRTSALRTDHATGVHARLRRALRPAADRLRRRRDRLPILRGGGPGTRAGSSGSLLDRLGLAGASHSLAPLAAGDFQRLGRAAGRLGRHPDRRSRKLARRQVWSALAREVLAETFGAEARTTLFTRAEVARVRGAFRAAERCLRGALPRGSIPTSRWRRSSCRLASSTGASSPCRLLDPARPAAAPPGRGRLSALPMAGLVLHIGTHKTGTTALQAALDGQPQRAGGAGDRLSPPRRPRGRPPPAGHPVDRPRAPRLRRPEWDRALAWARRAPRRRP